MATILASSSASVVFVLFLNRTQLVESVRGMYGAGVDADSYLSKFLQFSLSLPKVRAQTDDRNRSFNRIFCDSTLRLYGFPENDSVNNFADVLAVAADYFGLSLRDIERGVILFSLGQPIKQTSATAAWLISLKFVKPALFAGILKGGVASHFEAGKLAQALNAALPDYWFAKGIPSWHRAVVDRRDSPESEDGERLFQMSGSHSYRSESHLMQVTAKKLDLAVDD